MRRRKGVGWFVGGCPAGEEPEGVGVGRACFGAEGDQGQAWVGGQLHHLVGQVQVASWASASSPTPRSATAFSPARSAPPRRLLAQDQPPLHRRELPAQPGHRRRGSGRRRRGRRHTGADRAGLAARPGQRHRPDSRYPAGRPRRGKHRRRRYPAQWRPARAAQQPDASLRRAPRRSEHGLHRPLTTASGARLCSRRRSRRYGGGQSGEKDQHAGQEQLPCASLPARTPSRTSRPRPGNIAEDPGPAPHLAESRLRPPGQIVPKVPCHLAPKITYRTWSVTAFRRRRGATRRHEGSPLQA